MRPYAIPTALAALLLLAPAFAGPSDEPAAPPKDAVILFDGEETSQWQQRGTGKPATWPIEDGAMVTRDSDIYSKRTFSDYQLHVEFNVPALPPDVRGQARGNSGVYLHGLYEIQVLDSYGLQSKNNDCGAIYEQSLPMTNACKQPGEWQTYDILYHAPRYDASGKMTQKPRISALQNALWIQDNVEVDHPTRASMEGEVDPMKPGPIMLQFHGNAVRYRNIWVRPIP